MCIKKINNKPKIVLKSDKAKNIVLTYLYSNTVHYNWLNRLTNGWDILYKNKGGYFILYVSWKTEKRKFVGRIFEKDNCTVIEGSFRLPIMLTCWYMVILLMGLIVIIYSFFIFLKEGDIIKEMVFIIVSYLFFLMFDIWWLFIFRSKKYENRIIEFLKKCMEDET